MTGAESGTLRANLGTLALKDSLGSYRRFGQRVLSLNTAVCFHGLEAKIIDCLITWF